MLIENYNHTYFNEFGEESKAQFRPNEYHSLMELLFDKYVEEWGDFKGRAWCGTCHIQIIEGHISKKMDIAEKNTLSKIGDAAESSRLVCQIPVISELKDIVFRIVTDVRF